MFRWFETRIDPYPLHDVQQPPQGLLAFCLHYTRGSWKWLAIMAVLTTLIAITEISLFGFMGSVVDWLANADPTTFLADERGRLILMASIVLVIMPGLVFVSSMIIHQTLLGNVPQRMRWLAHRYLIRQSMSFFQDEFAGRIATRLMQTSIAVRETVMKLLDVMNYVVVYFSGAIILAAMNNWRLAVPFVVWLTCYIGLLFIFVPRLQKVAKAQAKARSTMTGRIVDSYTNIATVKLFSHSQREETYAREGMDGFLQTVHKQMRYATSLNVSIDVLNSLLLFSVGVIGIALWMQDAITPGAVAVALALVLRLFGMAHWIMWEMSALFENIGTVQDGISSISLPREVTDADDAKPLQDVKGEICFDKVRFNYGREGGIIDCLDLKIAPGEKIGLIGRSGAGKSTIVNLLLRYYDLEGGKITIDGQDISAVTQDSLRASIGVVTQDTSLLHRSVRENIAYGRPDASEEEMVRAASFAEAEEFVADLADREGNTGYDAQVGERGVKLSGGQRQRIAIARVLLKDAPILILDEATSALDSEVEAAIQGQLNMLMQNKTVIAIAHRLSTIAAMDRLIVLEAGEIVESGTHSELLKKDGHYAKLWQRQSGGFIDVEGIKAAQ